MSPRAFHRVLMIPVLDRPVVLGTLRFMSTLVRDAKDSGVPSPQSPPKLTKEQKFLSDVRYGLLPEVCLLPPVLAAGGGRFHDPCMHRFKKQLSIQRSM